MQYMLADIRKADMMSWAASAGICSIMDGNTFTVFMHLQMSLRATVDSLNCKGPYSKSNGPCHHSSCRAGRRA